MVCGHHLRNLPQDILEGDSNLLQVLTRQLKFPDVKKRVITFLQADEQAVHHEGQPVEGNVEAHTCLALPHAC